MRTTVKRIVTVELDETEDMKLLDVCNYAAEGWGQINDSAVKFAQELGTQFGNAVGVKFTHREFPA